MTEWLRDLTALIVAIGVIIMAIFRFIDQRAIQRRLDEQDRQAREQTQNVKAVVKQVEEVHKATNSLTDRLVEKTEREALARGGVEERARAEARKPNRGSDCD